MKVFIGTQTDILALGMILLELQNILQVFCVCQEGGGGVNRGS